MKVKGTLNPNPHEAAWKLRFQCWRPPSSAPVGSVLRLRQSLKFRGFDRNWVVVWDVGGRAGVRRVELGVALTQSADSPSSI